MDFKINKYSYDLRIFSGAVAKGAIQVVVKKYYPASTLQELSLK